MVQCISHCCIRKWMLHSQPRMILPFPIHWKGKLTGHTLGFGGDSCTPQCQRFLKQLGWNSNLLPHPLRTFLGKKQLLGGINPVSYMARTNSNPSLRHRQGQEQIPTRKGTCSNYPARDLGNNHVRIETTFEKDL